MLRNIMEPSRQKQGYNIHVHRVFLRHCFITLEEPVCISLALPLQRL